MGLMDINNEVDYRESFEELRLQFTSLFLQHPAMLKENSYEHIIKEAAKFTEMYINYAQSLSDKQCTKK